MIPLYVASKKIKKSIQTIQNRVLKIIYKTPQRTRTSTIHQIAKIERIAPRNEKLIHNFLDKAKENQTVQEIIDQHYLLDHKTYKSAHMSVIDQYSLI